MNDEMVKDIRMLPIGSLAAELYRRVGQGTIKGFVLSVKLDEHDGVSCGIAGGIESVLECHSALSLRIFVEPSEEYVIGTPEYKDKLKTHADEIERQ